MSGPAHRPALTGSGPAVVVLDVDGTLIEDEVVELLADHAGTRAEVAAVTAAAMRGEVDFEASLRARVASLEGLPVDVLAQVRDAVRLTPGAATLTEALLARGHVVGLASGGFVEVVRPVADRLGIVHVRANALQVAGGQLTGRVDGDVVGPAAKADFLRELAQGRGIDPARSVAVGDGANDLDMMAAAGVGVAFCAKPAVREAADVVVDERRLDLVLEAVAGL